MAGPVIQVVSGGTNWTAVVAAISGGLVGLAGIGATVWASVRTSRAENKREHLAEKRRVYINCLAAVYEMYRVSRMPDGPEKAAAYEIAGTALVMAVNAVSLIGTKRVSDAATTVGRFQVREFEHKPQPGNLGGKNLADLDKLLRQAIREDLGEPSLEGPAGLISPPDES